jgi:hypothetical protein
MNAPLLQTGFGRRATAPTINRKQRRAFEARVAKAVEEDRNGCPVHPEIAARMTKAKVQEPLYRVHVDTRDDGENVPISPAFEKMGAEMALDAITKCIARGDLPWATNAHLALAL